MSKTQDVFGSLVSGGILELLDEYPNGSAPGYGSISGWNKRRFTTTVLNTIQGVTLASPNITLPPGTYKLRGEGHHYYGAAAMWQKSAFKDSSGTVITDGVAGIATVGAPTLNLVDGFGVFAAETTLYLDQWVASGDGTYGMGLPISGGFTEVYGKIIIEKIG